MKEICEETKSLANDEDYYEEVLENYSRCRIFYIFIGSW